MKKKNKVFVIICICASHWQICRTNLCRELTQDYRNSSVSSFFLFTFKMTFSPIIPHFHQISIANINIIAPTARDLIVICENNQKNSLLINIDVFSSFHSHFQHVYNSTAVYKTWIEYNSPGMLYQSYSFFKFHVDSTLFLSDFGRAIFEIHQIAEVSATLLLCIFFSKKILYIAKTVYSHMVSTTGTIHPFNPGYQT